MLYFPLFILSIRIFSQILYFESFTSNSFQTSEEWVLRGQSKIYSNCGTKRLLGGYEAFGKGTSATKLVQLPPHHTIKITLEFWKIDSWDNEDFFIYLDQVQGFYQKYGSGGTQTCGISQGEIVQQITIIQQHNFQSVFILLTSNLDDYHANESWGIRNFKFYIYPCPSGCQTCISTDSREQCIFWNLIEDSLTNVDFNNFNADGWKIEQGYKKTSNCLSIPMLGGYDYTAKYSYMIKKINLAAHNQVKIKFRFIFIDSWNSEKAQFYVDSIVVWTQIYESNDRKVQNICGWTYDEILQNEEITIPHSKSSITLKFITTLDSDPNNESFGIRDIQIFIPCIFGTSFNQACGQICGNGIQEQYEQCDDGNIYAFDGCFICQYSCVEGCLNCIDGICFECDIGWIFQSDFNTCIAIVNDQKFQIWEECDDYLNFEICKNGKFICPSNCLICEFGICYDCIPGWKLIKQQCQSICGDNEIQILEECDDNNLIRFDGCNKCQNDCQRECSYCFRGICLNCIYGWHLNNQFICETQCGDSQIALISYEECDYLNSNQFDDCFECKLQCCHHCDTCIYGICYNCEYTFTLIDQICTPVCGDGLITIEYEQCDDMNSIPYDGCYQCKYQCRQYCKLCIKGICYDHCEYGFYEFDNQCITKCGDGIIAGQEDCDQLNDNQTDGCHNCQFHCPHHCDQCIEGQCKLCEQGYQLQKSQNQCKTFCGDGLVSIEEECDDMNQQDGDGCSQECKIEVNYVCKNYQYSFTQCTYVNYPQFEATFIKQNYEKQYVSLHFNQQVKVIDKIIFSELIEFNLIELDHEIFNITLIIVEEAKQYCSFVEYIIEIIFYKTLSSPPILEIIFNEKLYNQNNAPLLNLRDSVRLNLPMYIDDQQQKSALILKNIGKGIINSMGTASILLLLLGDSFLLRGVIEILQQQSYLRFINVVFPLNLFIYFETSSLITVQPILEFFNFNSYPFQIIDVPFTESYQKFQFYGINANIFNNLQTQIFFSLAFLFTYFACYFLIKFFRNLDDKYFFCFGLSLSKLFVKIQKKCFQIKRQVEKQGLREFLISNCWDLIFMSFLQIQSQSFTSARSIISDILAYLILYICVIIISSHFVKKSKATTISKYWLKKFDLFLILKKLLFAGVLVLFQKNQQIQSLLLTLICSLYLIYIIFIKQQKNRIEYINLLMMEISVFIFCLTVTFYWNEIRKCIDYDDQVTFGWFHITILLSVLITNLGLQLYAFFRIIKKVIVKKMLKMQNERESQGKDPKPLQNA